MDVLIITSAVTALLEHYYFTFNGDWWSQFTNMLKIYPHDMSRAGLEVRGDVHSNF